ncbi:SGNH/GDSL hydrolase family protein [Paenibacillus alvei]|uniref:SGNH/GDSL hydrolase family protein n=1 Tax=Paenibacillus alvei TaxID=44250 RepID=A0AAP7A2V0_PAEAL|nr:SGNH/GDSL hydrolase family protein [Paenibacillus alvei]
MMLQHGDKVVVIGDSITDCERARPYGEGLFGANGKGYVSLFDALVQTEHPEMEIRIVNMGVSGNTVVDLESRWETDVEELEPDVLVICIGINDVWRQFDMPYMSEQHVGSERYSDTYTHLIERSKPNVREIILMTPFYIEPNKEDAMRQTMDEYGRIVNDLANVHGAVLVDTQQVMDNLLKHFYPAALAWDRVHPSIVGHMALAKALYKVCFSN